MSTDNGNMKISPAEEWILEYNEGVAVTLSSGRNVRLKPVNTRTFLEYGGIPDYLTPHVEKFLLQLQSGSMSEMSLDDLKKQSEVMDVFCCTCIMEPKIVNKRPNNCEPGELSVDILSDDEKGEVFGTLGKSTRYIKNFFRQQEASLVAVYELQRVQSEAQRSYKAGKTNKRNRTPVSE